MMDADVDLVARFLAAREAADKDALAKLLHPDFEVIQSRALPYGGLYRGRDGYFSLVHQFRTTWQIDSFNQVGRYNAPVTDPNVREFVVLFRLVGSWPETGERIDTTLAEQWIFEHGLLRWAKPHWFEPPGINALVSRERSAG